MWKIFLFSKIDKNIIANGFKKKMQLFRKINSCRLKKQQNVNDKTFSKIFTKKEVETPYSLFKAERSIPKRKKKTTGG